MSSPSSLLQGVHLLEAAVARERSGRPGHSGSRLAEETGIERSRVSRVTQELRRLRYLQRDDAGAFAAGPTFFSTAAARNEPWLRAARGELRALASQLHMTAKVSAPGGQGALLLRAESGAPTAEAAMRPGMTTPIWCTGGGRALLWDHDRAALDGLLAGALFVSVGGPRAARSVAEVDALMARDRAVGLIEAAEEYVGGIVEFAVPVRAGEEIVASLAVSGPAAGGGGGRARRRRIARLLGDSAARLSEMAADA